MTDMGSTGPPRKGAMSTTTSTFVTALRARPELLSHGATRAHLLALVADTSATTGDLAACAATLLRSAVVADALALRAGLAEMVRRGCPAGTMAFTGALALAEGVPEATVWAEAGLA